MRALPPEITALINKREGISIRILFWIAGRNRSTGEIETIGIWNGLDTKQFAVNGQTRTYIGGGGFITMGDLKQEQGLNIQKLVANANPISPEFQDALREYNPRMARVEVHLAVADPETNNLVADPYRIFKGWIDTVSIKTPEKNDVGTATINMVSNARILTRKAAIKRSDENQRARLATDKFFQAVSISGSVQTPWGSKGTPNRNFGDLVRTMSDMMKGKAISFR